MLCAGCSSRYLAEVWKETFPRLFATSQMAGPALCPLVGLSCSHTTDVVADCVTLNGQRDATLPRERDSWECL